MNDSTQLKTTPLTAWHEAHGGRMVPFAGYSMPVQYTSVLAEHAAVREKVGLFDITHMGEVYVTGPARRRLDQQPDHQQDRRHPRRQGRLHRDVPGGRRRARRHADLPPAAASAG